ncbi:MAG TPA: primosomal protein N', partial [Chitinophagaceae bacterium]|nr:primosomal protein N' [Chitinophagaceae bacterium]
IEFTLTPAQQLALEQVQQAMSQHAVCLLHGVTSSGKTLVYIKIIEEFIRQGKQVLYLVPEIALTSQIIRRLQQHFGGYIGIYHSKFNQNERVETWNKIRSGELKVVLGARSSLFLPFSDLGLIIVDEEHDASYKQQDPAPRYHARDAAVYYASLNNAKVLLGSATPSIETYYNATTGKYGLVELNERYSGLQMPAIEIIDTKKIPVKEKTKVIVTPPLNDAIVETLERNKQVILFQNRRGYSPYQVCQVCGWIPQCKNCDVSLTFHKLTNRLQCHYCGTSYPPVHICAACGSHQFVQRNFGTERIEEQLEESFPHARVARMDVDTVRGKQAHDTLIQLFEQNRVDILVGTQMVVKGLDFENVDLVGILDADSLLHFADFRVNERAFQLMEQVSGRAGRKDKQGRVMIQVANTKHPVLQFVQQHNYKALFDFEINGRQRFYYPPFTRLIMVLFRHKIKETVQEAANFFGAQLEKEFANYLVGPAEPVIGRVRNQYLMEL